MKFRRQGDINLHPISKEEFEKFSSKTMYHDGSYIVARGEATGSKHVITVQSPKDMIIKEDGEIRLIGLLKEASITHTHDHETIIAEPGYYRQIREREVDHFTDSIIREVTD